MGAACLPTAPFSNLECSIYYFEPSIFSANPCKLSALAAAFSHRESTS